MLRTLAEPTPSGEHEAESDLTTVEGTHQSRLSPALFDSAPVRLAHRVVLEKLGQGGMGVVYAHPEAARELAAIASLHTRRGAEADALAAIERAVSLVSDRDSVEAAGVLGTASGVYEQLGQLERARESAARASELYEQLFGRDHEYTRRALQRARALAAGDQLRRP